MTGREKKIKEIVDYLSELKEDETITNGLRAKLDLIIKHLTEDSELGIDKSIHEIEEIMENGELPAYIRTRLWDVISMLESS